MKAEGIHIDVAANTTTKSKEIESEKRFFDYDLVCYMQTRHLIEDGTRWHFEVDDPVDAEDAFFQGLLPANMTNMAIARRVACQNHGGDHDHWKRLANYNETELAELMIPGAAMAIALAAPDIEGGGGGAPVAPVRGRGKGGARGGGGAAAPVKGRGKAPLGRGRGRGGRRGR